jgi:threonine/homoserine/homoserine lactone efflux protein
MPFPVEPHLLAAFAAASVVLLVIPGPTVIMVVSQALGHGARVAVASVIGVGLGDLAAATLSLLGVATVLAASATAFVALKWVGAVYLIGIGIRMWHSPVAPLIVDAAADDTAARSWPVFRDAFLVTLLNPKSIVFFAAFVPQFVAPGHAFAPQAGVLIVTFVVLGMINAAGYAALAGSARRLMTRPSVLRVATRTGAALLISAAMASLLARRSA